MPESYAPEHTRAAYQLAIDQGADYIEQDLQITKDGVLVCLHDPTLDARQTSRTCFPTKFLYEIGVDALFTDNPDQFPRR